MKKSWSPAKLSMGLARTSRPALSRLVPKKAATTTHTILDLIVGGSLAVAKYTAHTNYARKRVNIGMRLLRTPE